MEILDDKELYAVLAHELGHVKNYDMLVSTIAASIAGAISYLAQMAFFFGGSDEDGNSNPLAAIAMMLLAPFAAILIQMAVSRTREYGADAHSKQVTNGDGRALASALQKLESIKPQLKNYQPSPTEQTTAHLMFANMFNAQGWRHCSAPTPAPPTASSACSTIPVRNSSKHATPLFDVTILMIKGSNTKNHCCNR